MVEEKIGFVKAIFAADRISRASKCHPDPSDWKGNMADHFIQLYRDVPPCSLEKGCRS